MGNPWDDLKKDAEDAGKQLTGNWEMPQAPTLSDIGNNYANSTYEIVKGNTTKGLADFGQASANWMTAGAVKPPSVDGIDAAGSVDLEHPTLGPDPNDPNVRAARANEEARSRRGLAANVLTGSSSRTLNSTPNLSRQTLLGS
jgi:hypothetical protein